ncbi:putative zinc-binding metallopeptidase [Cereibacter sp. SYSU M97828]|nr:putative zinc-binding metallopeptidase [Cereibacter flavus]
MKRLACPVCQQQVHFANTICLNCQTELVYDPFAAAMTPLEGNAPCLNRDQIACNWPAGDGGFCESCAATETIPDLNIMGNLDRWSRVETAKRRLFYSLIALGLPRVSRSGKALRFSFMADEIGPDGQVVHKILTGHEEGAITINIAEADDDVREARRIAMGEPYRTLLGHLRHEVGHYYWEVLVKEAGREAECAEVFGDAAQDYAAALQRHYAEGPPQGWDDAHVSSYATAHPWEDWAETWAHMLHIVDGLDTARNHGLDPSGTGVDDAHAITDPELLMQAWIPLATAMNAMNRSMGHQDFYPFVISPIVAGKIGYILQLIHQPALSTQAVA